MPPVPDDGALRRRGRLKAALILLVCAAPTIAALAAYHWWRPEGRINYGELIEVRPLPAAMLSDLSGRPFSLPQLKGRWVMLQADGGQCEAACQRKLFDMRQVRLAQGREMDRIERVWLLLDDAVPSAAIEPLTTGAHLLRAKGSPLVGALPAAADVRDHIYLVDPLGNLMLRYPKDPDPRRMIKDLQRLLQVSRVG